MEINVRFLVILTFTILCNCLSAEPRSTGCTIDEGLVEVGSLAEVFDVERTQSSPRMRLTERMGHYGVPGVGIAIIDDYQVVSVQSFGVIEAGTDQAVTPETLFEAASTTKLSATVVNFRISVCFKAGTR